MRPFFKQFSRQQGLALLIILVIVVLGAMTVLVSGLNSTDINIAKQKQTMLALAQAKSALLGFAASYAENHPGQPLGYLPCPDQTGDGSVDVAVAGASPCSDKGKTILGRFPWRTLGLPPLRDGDGECLWYAVSGNYKDNPKMTLTSDTNGRFIVQDVNGNVIAGNEPNNRAIAIIFAPGKLVGDQVRGGNSGTATECGRTSAPGDDINQASKYLEQVKIRVGTDNYIISNSEGAVYTFTSAGTKVYLGVTNAGAVDTSGTEPAITPLTYDPDPAITNRIFRNNQMNCDSQELKECRSIFVTAPASSNDTLMLITPEDYKSIYTRMDLWVTEEVNGCFKGYFQKSSEKSYIPKYATSVPKYTSAIGQWDANPTSGYRKAYEDKINKYVNIEKLEYKASFYIKHKNDSPIPDPNLADVEEAGNKAKRNAIYVNENRLPWPAKLEIDATGNVNYADSDNERFGRIPQTLTTTFNSGNQDLSDTWNNNCFTETGNWSWWKEWKEMVFYAIDDDYTSDGDVPYFRVNATQTKCSSCNAECQQKRTCLLNSSDNTWWVPWVAGLKPPFDEVTSSDIAELGSEHILTPSDATAIKNSTRAKILVEESPLQEDSWCVLSGGTLPSSPATVSWCATSPSGPHQLTLDVNGVSKPFNHVILVAGRRLHLNQGSTDNEYPDYQQTRDSVQEKIKIKNYLEGEEHPHEKLRKMNGKNIPQNGEADTIPTGNEEFFGAKKPVEFDYFNDVACGSGQDCRKSLE